MVRPLDTLILSLWTGWSVEETKEKIKRMGDE